MNQENMPISESVNVFNTFVSEVRNRIESLIKQLLLVSGGIQTITISAFLSGNKPELTAATISLLKCAWFQLSVSIILCLIFMLLQILALTHVVFKHKDKLENQVPGVEIMTAWLPLRILNRVVGLSAFFFCVYGVYTISKAAISLIGA
ncbi:MAG: hypothetical protein WAW61_05680 [Methylococcaceae bacterium]